MAGQATNSRTTEFLPQAPRSHEQRHSGQYQPTKIGNPAHDSGEKSNGGVDENDRGQDGDRSLVNADAGRKDHAGRGNEARDGKGRTFDGIQTDAHNRE